jgi:hypothetical protein
MALSGGVLNICAQYLGALAQSDPGHTEPSCTVYVEQDKIFAAVSQRTHREVNPA